MMKNLFTLFLLFFLVSCEDNTVDNKSPIQRNVIVLLDLSDRIIVNKNQPYLDKQTITSIVDVFLNSIKDTIIHYDKNFGLIKDKFRLRIADQKGMRFDKRPFEESLQFDFSNNNQENVKYILKEFRTILKEKLDTLYSLATISNNPKDYFGADIWKFFNEDLETMIIKNANTKNYLFIITDGYLYFESYNKQIKNTKRRTDMKFLSELRNKDWETTFDEKDMGLIPLNKDFSNLKIAVMEIAPKDFWNEFDLIKKVWKKWFKEMGVEEDKVMFSKSDNPTNIQNKIIDFLK